MPDFKKDWEKYEGKWSKKITEYNTKYGGALPYASLLNTTIGNLRRATEVTYNAFRSGDPVAGSGGVLEMIGMALPMAGALVFTGPLGSLAASIFGSIFALVGATLTNWKGQTETLSMQIRKELDLLSADMVKNELGASKDDLEFVLTVLEKMHDHSRSWEDIQATINLSEGNATHELNVSRSWLRNNLKNAEWPKVFKLYWYAVMLRTQVFSVMIGKLVTDEESDAIKIGSAVQQAQIKRDESFAHELHRAALDAGTLWHVGTDHSIYKREGQKPWSSTDLPAVNVLAHRNIIYRRKTNPAGVFAHPAGEVDQPIRLMKDPESGLPMSNSFSVVQVGANRVYVFAIDHKGALHWRAVPLEKNGHPEKGDEKPTDDVIDLPFQLHGVQVVANGDGHLIFLFVSEEGLYGYRLDALPLPKRISKQDPHLRLVQEKVGGRAISGVHGVAADAKHLFAYTEKLIYRSRLDFAEGSWLPRWELMDGPDALRKNNIKHLATSEDGQLLVVAGDQIWALYENVMSDKEDQEKATYWEKVPGVGAATAVCKLPITDYELFKGYLSCCREDSQGQ